MNEKEKILRVIDVNLNRSREGLRVIEDILRLVFDDSSLSSKTRTLRHSLSIDNDLRYRNSEEDIGSSFNAKNKKDNIYGLVRANIRRAQEAVRVLEESKKLIPQEPNYQAIRFDLYQLEKDIIEEYFSNA